MSINELSISDITGFISAIFSILALFISIITFNKVDRQNRSLIVSDILKEINNDDEVMDMFYKIDWNHFKFDPISFPRSDEQRKLDKLLINLSIGSTLYENKTIRISDILPLIYFIKRVTNNEHVMNYIYLIQKSEILTGLKNHSLDALVRVSKKI